jgi:hypothetical protein
MSSLFASRAYYAFGFLALTAGVVALTTGTVTILFIYFNLCAEEYRYVEVCLFVICYLDSPCRWHWRAFLTGGGSAFWILAYGLFYWLSRLSLHSLSSVALYLGYLFLICIFDFIVTGKGCLMIMTVDSTVSSRNHWIPRILLGCAALVQCNSCGLSTGCIISMDFALINSLDYAVHAKK